MSDTVLVVAIVALVVGPLGILALFFGHRFNMKTHVTADGAGFSAESQPVPSKSQRRRQ